jgi:hypothetical protein
MNMPGFSAEDSLYKTSKRYQASRHPTNSTGQMVVPAVPPCGNCDYILDRCSRNGWRPRAVCNACARGDCYDEPPMPDPFPDPFEPLPRF